MYKFSPKQQINPNLKLNLGLKNKIALLLTGLSLFVDSTLAHVAPVTSKIDAITIYTDKAQVQRSGQVKLQDGEQVLVFNNLPANLIAN